MMKLDHLSIPVVSLDRSRAWYVATLGLKVEFEVPERRSVALQDSNGFAIFLQEVLSAVDPNGCAL
jgi:catechol 2,3-dioxygenase-like lactoylglutathione lyase family enzyme